MFLFHQVRNHDDPMLIVEFDSKQGLSVARYDPKIETFSWWLKHKNTKKPKLLDIIQEMRGTSMVKTLKDTSALEAATMTMHSAMFTQVVVKNMELKLVEYENDQMDMNKKINQLSIENVKLKQQLEGAMPSQGK